MKKFIMAMIVIGVMLFSFIISIAHPFQAIDSPKAENGTLDLTNWSFKENGAIKLEGEWEIYKERLLTPSELAGYNEYAEVRQYFDPSATRSMKQLFSLEDIRGGGIGARTYKLHIHLGEEPQHALALKLSNIKTSSKLYVNGQEVGGHGQVSLDAKQAKAGNRGYEVYFEAGSSSIEVVLQVANYSHYNFPYHYSIWLGSANSIAGQTSSGLAIELTGTAICFIIFIYHLYVAVHTRVIGSLYFSLMFLCLTIMFLNSGELMLVGIFQHAPYELLLKLVWICRIGLRILLQLYLVHQVAGLLSPAFHKFTMSTYWLSLGFILLFDSVVYTKIIEYMSLYFLGIMTYLFWRLFRKWLQLDHRSLRNDVLIYLVIVFFWMISYYNTALYSLGLISNKSIGSMAVASFIFISQLLLAIRYIRSEERIKRMDKVKEDFLVNSAYYLRGPLDSMLSMTANGIEREKNKNQLIESDAHIQYKMMNQLVRRVIHQVNATIDLALLRNKELKLNRESVPLKASLTRAVEAITVFGKEKGIAVKLDVHPTMKIIGDEERMYQVLYALIRQAANRTGATAVSVSASLSGSMICISVQDDGAYISSSRQSQLFDPNIIDDTDAGLTMYMTRALVQAMDGRLELDWSIEGKGNCFKLRLPGYMNRHELQVDDSQQLLEIRTESLLPAWNELGSHETKQQTVLIVEDQYYNIQTLQDMLVKNGYVVLYAYSGEEAMPILAASSVDLVLVDITLQGQSGIELCRQIRNQYSMIELPVILMAVGVEHDELERGFEAGANDFLHKPFVELEVLARVKGMLSLQEASRLAVQHELSFLQAQIKPHFIYNAINTMISLCYVNPEQAAKLLTDFSQYLRLVFDVDNAGNAIALSKELELIQVYVGIERMRFGDKYKLELDVPEQLQEVRIPSLCIQPLVENAIKHGLYSKEEGGTIKVAVRLNDRELAITVSDDGVGMSEAQLKQLLESHDQTGVGFGNVQKRIRQQQHASLTLHSEQGKGTEVTIRFMIRHEITN